MVNKNNWTEDELDLIRQIFPTQGWEPISVATNRSEAAIKVKAGRIGVYHHKDLDEYFQLIPLEIRAYLAGHFDGEGCVRFRAKHNTYSPTIQIGVCNYQVLELYQKFFGGQIKAKSNPNGHKQMFFWKIVGFKDLLNFFKAVLPFSIEKKEQMELCLLHIEEWAVIGNRTNPGAEFRALAKQRHEACTSLKKI